MRRGKVETSQKNQLWLVFGLALILVTNVPKAAGQGSSYLTGFVRDSSGGLVPGATVVIKSENTGAEYNIVTTETGVYRSPALDPGSYDVTVQAKGFQTVVQHKVEIQVGQARGLDVTLPVGALTQRVEVTAAAPALKTEDAGLGQNVTAHQVQALPEFSRSAGLLIALAPGVRFTADDVISYGTSRYNIAGQSNANVTIDGTRVMGDREDIAQMIINPSVETVSEEKVVENQYNAEFGKDIGGLVQMETKSGTNSFHGGVYEYFRNDALDSYNGFSRTKAPDKQHMFGGTIGGPIKKDKLFFFGSMEAWKATTPSGYVLTVPTAAEKNGDFSALLPNQVIYNPATTRTDPITGNVIRDAFQGNIIPGNMIDPVAQNVLKYIPDPISPGLTENLDSASGRNLRKVKGVEKVDWNISDKDRLSGIWMFDFTKNTDLGIAAYNKIAPQMSPRPGEPGFIFGTQVYSFHEVHTISPTEFLSARFAYRPRRIERQNNGIDPAGKWAEKLGIKNYAGARLPASYGGDLGTPGFNFTGYTNVGSGFLQFKENPIEIIDWDIDLTYVHSKHTFKGGFSYEYGKHDIPDQSFPTGNFTFDRGETSLPFNRAGGDGFASFLLGQVDSAQTTLGPLLDQFSTFFDAYIQDDWKVKPGLTLNFGVRWDVDLPLREAQNRGSGFDFYRINPVSGTPGVITFLGSAGYPYNTFYDTAWHRFSPRFGFAWQAFPKTVIRGGAGTFSQAPYLGAQNGLTTGFTTNAAFASPDGGISPSFILQNGFPDYPLGGNRSVLTDAFGAVPVGQSPNTSVNFVPRHQKFGYTQNVNVSIERELPWQMVFEVAGMGVLGRNLWISQGYNEVPPNLWGLPGANNARRPFPQFQNVNNARADDKGTTNYWGGYVRLDKRFSSGLSVIANYNYGRSVGFIGGSLYYPQLSRGPNLYDIANGLGNAVPYQTATISWVYELPWGPGKSYLNSGAAAKILGGWNIGGFLSLEGGIPYGITSGVDSLNGNSPLGNRVNLIGDPHTGAQTHDHWFNTSAFARAGVRDNRRILL